jgi:hypothetical protein
MTRHRSRRRATSGQNNPDGKEVRKVKVKTSLTAGQATTAVLD